MLASVVGPRLAADYATATMAVLSNELLPEEAALEVAVSEREGGGDAWQEGGGLRRGVVMKPGGAVARAAGRALGRPRVGGRVVGRWRRVWRGWGSWQVAVS